MAVTYASNEYQIPRGRVFFDPLDINDARTGERYLGNCPAFTVSVETEKAEHYSSETGLKQKDQTIVLQVNRTAEITCDNMSGANVALFLSGEESTVSQGSASVTNEAISVIPGRYYQLGQTDQNPQGARSVSAVVVTNVAGTTTYALGTDYELDADLGRLHILAGGTIGTATIHVDYTKAVKTWSRITTGANSELKGVLRIVSDNASGANRDFVFPLVTLTPNGELPVIADGTEFAQVGFSVEILKPANAEAMYIDGRPA